MARKRATKELRQERTIIIGAGLTEQYYFSHLKKLFNVNIIVRPRFFGKENIDALEQRIEQVLETNSKAIVVFDADVSQWNAVEQTKLKALKKKYANHIQVLLCDSMPSIEYWFLLHYVNTNRYFGTSAAVINELTKHIEKYDKSETFLSNQQWINHLCNNNQLKTAFQRAQHFGTAGESYTHVWKAIEKIGIQLK